MPRYRLSLGLLGLLCQSGFASALSGARTAIPMTLALAGQLGPPRSDLEAAPHTPRTRQVTFALRTDPPAARPGQAVRLRLTATLAPGWHIYSITENSGGPVPTTIRLLSTGPLESRGSFTGPAPTVQHDPSFNKDVEYHSRAVTWTQDLDVPADLAPQSVALAVSVRYMLCSDRSCLPPRTVRLQTSVTVAPGPGATTRRAAPTSRALTATRPSGAATRRSLPPAQAVGTIQRTIQQGFWAFLGAAVVAGFLSLLTPCVFPMIPITISFFLKQAERRGTRPVRLALAYCVGIVVLYTLIGVLLAVALGASGANRLSNSPWLNLILGAVFVAFALSLFGLFEFRVPSRVLQFTGAKESSGQYIGVMFMALTFTLTSFTCTFPFVGALLVLATQGNWTWPIVGTAVYAGAFASPFFFLAVFPSWLAGLPKSGGWMNAVKVVLGMAMVAVAIKFLSVADVVWDLRILTFSSVVGAWATISVVTGLYVLGKIRLPADSPVDTVGGGRLVLSALFLALGVYLASGIFGNRLHPWIQSYPPAPRPGELAYGARTSGQQTWLDNLDAALAQARREGKPVFVDFTGKNCTNCKYMEQTVFAEPTVVERLHRFVLVKLYTDVGAQAEANQRLQEKLMGTVELPGYVVLDRTGTVVARAGGLQGVAAMVRLLDHALR